MKRRAKKAIRMDNRNIRLKVEDIIGLFLSALQKRNIYGKEHNLTKAAIDKLYSAMTAALDGRKEITIGIIGNEVAFEEKPLYEISRKIGKLIRNLKDARIEKVSFLSGVRERELAVFIDALVMAIKPRGGNISIKTALEADKVNNILVGHIGIGPDSGTEKYEAGIDEQAQAGSTFQEGIDFLKQTLSDMGDRKPVDMRAAHLVVARILKGLLKNMPSLLILTSLKKHDEHTFVHSLNAAIFTLVQAEALGLPEELLADIGVAALLHDIGKLSVEAEIIRKYGKLNRQELEKIHSHPVDGAEILLEMPDAPLLAVICAFEHHLKYNMQGYPARLYGDKLNLASMMITIADAYDSMRGEWPPEKEFMAEKVYEKMMELSGEDFNPDLLDAFFTRIGVYPPGTLVELDNKAVGLVVKESSIDIRRPQVEMLYDSNGREEEEFYIINLLEKDKATGRYRHTIVKSIPISGKYKVPAKYNK